jgi:hypothetical protein
MSSTARYERVSQFSFVIRLSLGFDNDDGDDDDDVGRLRIC